MRGGTVPFSRRQRLADWANDLLCRENWDSPLRTVTDWPWQAASGHAERALLRSALRPELRFQNGQNACLENPAHHGRPLCHLQGRGQRRIRRLQWRLDIPGTALLIHPSVNHQGCPIFARSVPHRVGDHARGRTVSAASELGRSVLFWERLPPSAHRRTIWPHAVVSGVLTSEICPAKITDMLQLCR